MSRFALILAFALTCVVTRAQADEHTGHSLALTYARHPEASACPDRDAMVGKIAAGLGYSPFHEDAPTKLEIEITRTNATTLHARVTLHNEQDEIGERELDSTDATCAELSDAIVLASVIAIDPGALRHLAQNAESAQNQAASDHDENGNAMPVMLEDAPPRATDNQTIAAEPAVHPSISEGGIFSNWNLSLGAGAGVVGGTTPNANATIGAWADVQRDWFSLTLGGHYDTRTSIHVGAGTFGAYLAAGDLAACAHQSLVYECAVAVVGALHGSAAGLPGATTSKTMHVAAGARVGIDVSLSQWISLRPEAELTGVITNTWFFAGDFNIWRTPRVTGSLQLFAVVHFP